MAGAYENPAQIVDTKSGQMIGAALASIGQSIGKGIAFSRKNGFESNFAKRLKLALRTAK